MTQLIRPVSNTPLDVNINDKMVSDVQIKHKNKMPRIDT